MPQPLVYYNLCHVNTMKYQTGMVFSIKDHATKYIQELTYANSSFFMKYSTMMMTQILFLTAVNLS